MLRRRNLIAIRKELLATVQVSNVHEDDAVSAVEHIENALNKVASVAWMEGHRHGRDEGWSLGRDEVLGKIECADALPAPRARRRRKPPLP